MTVYYCGSSPCAKCGRETKHLPNGGRMRRHFCTLRWVSRLKVKARGEGWESGYRFGLTYYDDPPVQTDRRRYLAEVGTE